MNKRGDTTTLLILITGVILLITIVPITMKIVDTGKDSADLEGCKAAVRFTGFKPIAGVRALGDETKIKKNCKPETQYFTSKINDNDASLKIMNDIKTCWSKFGEAKVDFISGWDEGSSLCLPCNVYRSEIDRKLSSGSIIATYINKIKIPTNIAIENGNIDFLKLDKFKDEYIKNDFYIEDREGFYPGLYMIYVASKDKTFGPGEKILSPGEIPPKRSAIQLDIKVDENLYKSTQSYFTNPKSEVNFFSFILITTRNDIIKKYCGQFYKPSYYESN